MTEPNTFTESNDTPTEDVTPPNRSPSAMDVDTPRNPFEIAMDPDDIYGADNEAGREAAEPLFDDPMSLDGRSDARSDLTMLDAWSSGSTTSRKSWEMSIVTESSPPKSVPSNSPPRVTATEPAELMRELQTAREYLDGNLAEFMTRPAVLFFADWIRPGITRPPHQRMAVCNEPMMAMRQIEATLEWMVGNEARLGYPERAAAFAAKHDEVRELRLGFLAGRINGIPGEVPGQAPRPRVPEDDLLPSDASEGLGDDESDITPPASRYVPEPQVQTLEAQMQQQQPPVQQPQTAPHRNTTANQNNQPSTVELIPETPSPSPEPQQLPNPPPSHQHHPWLPAPPSPPPRPDTPPWNRRSRSPTRREPSYRDRSPLGNGHREHYRRAMAREIKRLDEDPEAAAAFDDEMQRVAEEANYRRQQEQALAPVDDDVSEVSAEERERWRGAQLAEEHAEQELFHQLQGEVEQQQQQQQAEARVRQMSQEYEQLQLDQGSPAPSTEEGSSPINFAGFGGADLSLDAFAQYIPQPSSLQHQVAVDDAEDELEEGEIREEEMELEEGEIREQKEELEEGEIREDSPPPPSESSGGFNFMGFTGPRTPPESDLPPPPASPLSPRLEQLREEQAPMPEDRSPWTIIPGLQIQPHQLARRNDYTPTTPSALSFSTFSAEQPQPQQQQPPPLFQNPFQNSNPFQRTAVLEPEEEKPRGRSRTYGSDFFDEEPRSRNRRDRY